MRVFLQQIKKFEVDVDVWARRQTDLNTPQNQSQLAAQVSINERLEEAEAMESETLLNPAEGVAPPN